jgi:hypothetical protein
MRLTRYKEAIDLCDTLPLSLAEDGIGYGVCPRNTSKTEILVKARKDERLHHGEFVELYNHTYKLIS